MLIETKKGPVAVHLSYLSQFEQRLIQIDCKDQSIEADLNGNIIREYRNGKMTRKRRINVTLEDCFDRQVKYFFKNIKNRKMMNNAFESAELMKKIHQFMHRN